jgi:hypothetical protein
VLGYRSPHRLLKLQFLFKLLAFEPRGTKGAPAMKFLHSGNHFLTTTKQNIDCISGRAPQMNIGENLSGTQFSERGRCRFCAGGVNVYWRTRISSSLPGSLGTSTLASSVAHSIGLLSLDRPSGAR